jgi:hypothetical protein
MMPMARNRAKVSGMANNPVLKSFCTGLPPAVKQQQGKSDQL